MLSLTRMTTIEQGQFEYKGGPFSGKGKGRGGRAVAGRELQKLFDRMPPYSNEAEMSLLGSMILDHRVIAEVIGHIPTGDAFYSESHAAVYDALVSLYDRHDSGDVVQLVQALKDKGVIDEIGGPSYLYELASAVPAAVNAPHYARIVAEKFRLRKLIDAAGTILHSAYHAGELGDDGASAVLDEAEQRIFDVVETGQGMDSEKLSQLLQQTLDVLDKNFETGRTITGLDTGFRDLNDLTSGFQNGEMIILAARPSMGKTAVALNLAENMAAFGNRHATGDADGQRAPVAFFSMEMSKQAITQRLLCSNARIDSNKMRKNQLTKPDFDRLVRSCSQLSKYPIYIDDTPGMTILQLRAKARRLSAQFGIKAVFIDYLQLMTAPGASRDGRQNEVATISRGVKALARELNIPVICLAQLNRGAEQREGHRPRMADLRESGSLEQDADVIMLLHREDYYHRGDTEWLDANEDEVGKAEIIIAKQRNGPTDVVRLSWSPEYMRFQDYASSNSFGGDSSYASPPQAPSSPGSAASSAPGSAFRKSGNEAGPAGNYSGPNTPGGWEEADTDDIPI